MPQRKTKCPHCGEFIYVRTRPADEQRVLVTEIEAEEMEAQWNYSIEMRPQIMQRDEKTLTRTRDDLRKKFCQPPSEQDVLWRIFNEELVDHSTKGMWALYTHVLFEMGELLMNEGRIADALGQYLDAFYLGQNGPRNIDPSMIHEGYPAFKPGNRIPEQYIKRIIQMMSGCEIVPEQLESLFMRRAHQLYRDLRLPVPPQPVWNALSVYL